MARPTIIGVTPPEFFGVEVGQAFDVALPLGTEALIRGKDTLLDGQGYWLKVMLRLKPGQSVDAATAALRGLQPQIREAALPRTLSARLQQEFLKEPFTLVSGSAGTSRLRQQYQRPLQVILIVVALVLLVACANIANVLLARAAARRHELSVRLAVGAPRWRLARQLLVESGVLAVIGAALGLLIASWGSRLLIAQLSNTFDHVFLDVSRDRRVLLFTMAVTSLTAILFGAAPALLATRVAPLEAMKEQGRAASAGEVRWTLSSGLVVAQLALSLVLVVAAGLFVRTFERLATAPLGFERNRVLVVNADLSRLQMEAANRPLLYDRLVRAVAAVPGVAHAAVSMVTPISGLSMTNLVEVPGAADMSERDRTVLINYVTPEWFATYGAPVREGRDIDGRDARTAPPVLVVNEAFARKFFAGRGVIGGTVANAVVLRRGQAPIVRTVVGVVGDTVYRSVRDPMQPTVHAALAQMNVPPANVSLSVNTSGQAPVWRSHAALRRR